MGAAPACCFGGNESRGTASKDGLEAPIVMDLAWTALFPEPRSSNAHDETPEVSEDETQVQESNTLSPEKSVADRSSRRRGIAKPEENKLNAKKDIVSKDARKVPKPGASVYPPSVSQLGDGKWRVHGIHEHRVLHAGLLYLDKILESGNIDKLPLNDQGKSLLRCRTLCKDLLKGARKIKDVPPVDIAGAQKDLPHLSLRQLIRLRALNIDFVPGGNSVHSALLSMVDTLIFQRLGKRATNSNDPSKIVTFGKLGRSVVILIELTKYFSVSQRWICWFGDQRIFLDTVRLACTHLTDIGIEGGALEYTDNSEPDRLASGQNKWLDFTVKHVSNESELGSYRPVKPKVTLRGGVKASTNSKHELEKVHVAPKADQFVGA